MLYFRVQPVERTCHNLNGGEPQRCPARLCRHRPWEAGRRLRCVRSPRGRTATPPLRRTPGAERHSDVWRWRLPGVASGGATEAQVDSGCAGFLQKGELGSSTAHGDAATRRHSSPCVPMRCGGRLVGRQGPPGWGSLHPRAPCPGDHKARQPCAPHTDTDTGVSSESSTPGPVSH